MEAPTPPPEDKAPSFVTKALKTVAIVRCRGGGKN